MSFADKVRMVIALLAVFVSGAFFGYLRAARIAVRLDERWRARVNYPPDLTSRYAWELQHPIRAALVSLWMLAAIGGPFWALGNVFIMFWQDVGGCAP